MNLSSFLLETIGKSRHRNRWNFPSSVTVWLLEAQCWKMNSSSFLLETIGNSHRQCDGDQYNCNW